MSHRWPTELRHAARSLVRAPGFSAVSVLVLGLGIGVTSSFYAFVKQVLIDPLAYPDANRLVVVRSEVPGSGTEAEWGASSAQYVYFREHAETLEDIGALRYDVASAGAQGSEWVGRTRIGLATAGVLRMMGARAILGRRFDETDDDPGAPLTAVLSRRYWQSNFGGDAGVVGKTLRIDRAVIGGMELLVPVVGVVEPIGEKLADVDIWLPQIIDPAGPHYNDHNMIVVAKLKPNATHAGAQAEVDGLTGELPGAFPQVYWEDFMAQFGFRTRLRDLKAYLVGQTAPILSILLGAAALLLVVAWADIACLMLSRVETGRRDMAVRVALGAGRAVVGRHYAAQSGILAGAGGLVGCAVAWWLCRYLVVANPMPLPRLGNVSMDGGVVAFTALVSFLLAVTLTGAVASSWRDPKVELGDAGRGTTTSRPRQRMRSALIAGQVALALALITAAGLLVASFRNLVSVDPGIDTDGVVKITAYPTNRYPDHLSWWRLLRDAEERIDALPGVAVVGAASSVPFATGGCVGQGFADAAVTERVGASELTTCAAQDVDTPGYFEAMGIRLLRGRTLDLADFDDPSRGSAVVSRAFAERFWPGQDPIGKRLAPHGRSAPWYTVVGLVGDSM